MGKAKGISIRTTIDGANGKKSRVDIAQIATYQSMTPEAISKLWSEFSPSIINGNFDDTTWSTNSKYGDRTTILCFDNLCVYTDSIKVYALLLLHKGLDPYFTFARTRNIIYFIIDSDYFSDKFLSDFADEPELYCKTATIVQDVCDFIHFVPINADKYLNILNSLKFGQNQVRTIPTFNSVVKFDAMINDLIKHGTYPEKFQIVVIWWKLTSVVPIRPIEFFTLRKSCIISKGGKHYIHLDRAKVKESGEKEVPVLEEIGISDEIFNLLNSFICNNIDTIPNEDSFLFNTLSQYGRHYRGGYNKYVGSDYMYYIFDLFFDEIVHNIYGYKIVEKGKSIELASTEIERFQYGDTRHIAFLNLLLSGVSPYTIAQIGGHTTLRTQLFYYDHLEFYMESKAYTMATQSMSAFHNLENCFELYRRFPCLDTLTYNTQNVDLTAARKIEYGQCNSSDFPYECGFDDCIDCPHCIPDKNHVDLLQKKIDVYKQQLDIKIDYLKKIIQNLRYFPTVQYMAQR